MDRSAKRQPRHQQQAGDLAFWRAQPMAERMAAVELLRQQAINPMGTPDAEPRLQRVCRIAQRHKANKRASGRLKDLESLEAGSPPADSAKPV